APGRILLLLVGLVAAGVGADCARILKMGVPEYWHGDRVRQHRQHLSREQMRKICDAMFRYAVENEGRFPHQLDMLREAGYLAAEDLRNPRCPSTAVGYVYVRPRTGLAALTDWPQTPLLYEAFVKWPRTGVLVMYCDGHSSSIASEAELRTVVARLRKD
ncbi:unnamed protein product, partial [marine sediment metagenome]